jgi:heme/copper-type cytochrome/quinol oxidase subunit 2
MFGDLVLFADIVRMWYALPLILVVSLVYGATRHELPGPIIEHAVRFGSWIVVFMAVLFVVIWFVSGQ